MSSLGYTRGPICGVDNCPSNLWKRINGRNVCQYGHVNEYDVEIDDEDDNLEKLGASGSAPAKRLTKVAGLTKNRSSKIDQIKSSSKIEVLYGDEARKLYYKAGQIILVKSCKLISDRFGLQYDVFKKYVKLYWAIFLSKNSSRLFNISELITLLHLSLLKMKIPVYLIDLLTLARAEVIPYQNSYRFLPTRITYGLDKKLLNFLTIRRNLFGKANNLIIKLDLKSEFQLMKLNYAPLLLKLILQLNLPLEIFLLTSNFIKMMKVDLSFTDLVIDKVHKLPEIKLYSIFIIIVRFYFSQHEEVFGRWCCLYNEYKDKKPALDKTINLNNTISMMINESSFENLLNWNEDKTNEYLRLFQENYLPVMKDHGGSLSNNNKKFKARSNLQRKIDEIFQLEDIPPQQSYENDDGYNNSSSPLKEWKDHLIEIYTKLYFKENIDEPDHNTTEQLTPVNKDVQHTQLMDILIEKFKTDTGLTFLQIDKGLNVAEVSFHSCMRKNKESYHKQYEEDFNDDDKETV